MIRVLFPLWQLEQQEYQAVCAHLGIVPEPHLYRYLSEYLASAPFRFNRPKGFALFLAKLRRTRFRIARLDLTTKLFLPDHPIRHVLNGVIALHECDGKGYRQMSAAPAGWTVLWSLLGWALGFAFSLALTMIWLGWQALAYVAGMPLRPKEDLTGKRILITGVNRGLGMDLMLHCLEQGAELVGIVRNRESLDDLKARLPAAAPVQLLVADLSTPGAFVGALLEAQVPADSFDIAILCAGVKHSGTSVLSLASLRETFQVNLFSAVEFAAWLRTSAEDQQPSNVTLVLISSMGRWHGMHFSCGYNASKAALSIWAESLEMEMLGPGAQRFSLMIVEPGMFESGMTRHARIARFLFTSRRNVARRILSGALAGNRTMRPPFWFALLTWGICLGGRGVRSRLLARANK